MTGVIEMLLAAMVISGCLTSAVRVGADARAVRKAADAGAWDFLDRRADRVEARRARRAQAWKALRQARHRQAGGDGNYRPGARAYFADVYHGWWEDQAAKRAAKRAVRPKPVYRYDPESGKAVWDGPARRSRRDRWSAALDKTDAAIIDRARRFRQSRVGQALIDPVGDRRPEDVADDPRGPSPFQTASLADVDEALDAQFPAPRQDPWQHSRPITDSEATVRLPDRREAARPECEARSEAAEDAASTYKTRAYCGRCGWASEWGSGHNHDPRGEAERHVCADGVKPPVMSEAEEHQIFHGVADAAWDADQPDSDIPDNQTPAAPGNDNGGTNMTAATGEAVNYETHKAELAAARDQWQAQLDQADAAARAAAQTKAALDALQQTARAAQGAAQAKADNLAARGMDGETMGHAGTQAEVMDVNQLDAMYEQLEAAEQQAAEARAAAEAGLAAVDAEEASIDAKYADAHATVASELGGDASYLDSGGAAAPAKAA